MAEVVLARINGQDLTLDEVARSPEFVGDLRALVRKATVRRLIAQEAEKRGLSIGTTELQDAVNAFRRRHKLHRAKDTERWMDALGITQDDLEAELRYGRLYEKVMDAVATSSVEQHFHENRPRWDQVVTAHLVVEEEGKARELLTRIEEDEAQFETLARDYSTDAATARLGGYQGAVRRGKSRPEVESRIFAARAGDVVGPFEVKGGWELVEVLEVRLATLDDRLRAEIAQELFAEWLQERVADARVEFVPLRA